jgi:hypothetical protein
MSIVILRDKIKQIAQKKIRLIFRDTVDAFSEAFVDVDGLPTSYGCGTLAVNRHMGYLGLTICADYRMDG